MGRFSITLEAGPRMGFYRGLILLTQKSIRISYNRGLVAVQTPARGDAPDKA